MAHGSEVDINISIQITGCFVRIWGIDPNFDTRMIGCLFRCLATARLSKTGETCCFSVWFLCQSSCVWISLHSQYQRMAMSAILVMELAIHLVSSLVSRSLILWPQFDRLSNHHKGSETWQFDTSPTWLPHVFCMYVM